MNRDQGSKGGACGDQEARCLQSAPKAKSQKLRPWTPPGATGPWTPLTHPIRLAVRFLVLALLTLCASEATAEPTVHMLSTQLAPIEEARRFTEHILSRFTGPRVIFQPAQLSVFLSRLADRPPHATGEIDLAAGLVVEELQPLADQHRLLPLTDLEPRLRQQGIPDETLDATRPNPQHPRYIVPWLHATYIMAARKEALAHLPPGADPQNLTYDDLLHWGETLHRVTGSPKIGLPAGEKGLLLMLLPGTILPAFTGSVVNGFVSPEAEAAWEWLRRVWPHVHPASTTFHFMQDHLLSGEVWVTLEHTARLTDAFRRQPDTFVALPVPRGPKGRFSRLTTNGLAIPDNAPHPEAARKVIEFLTQPATQEQLLLEEGFLPVTPITDQSAPELMGMVQAAERQNRDPLTQRVHQPRELGHQETDFNAIFLTTFSRIVLRGKPVAEVIRAQGAELATLYQSANAPCVPPDRAGERPCRVNPAMAAEHTP
ncbi:MAG: carbohydrate ABC transporter substrate-binding protein [Magnetococcales bacterium]|nr:carbohydrate ABC transporter substrate-binding protein [Magnetococcales bacterium]